MARRRTAKSVCRGCLVGEECLAYPLDDRTLWGVSGGLTERERARAEGRFVRGAMCSRSRPAKTPRSRRRSGFAAAA